MKETKETDCLEVIENEIARTYNKKALKQMNKMSTIKEDEQLKQLNGDYLIQMICEDLTGLESMEDSFSESAQVFYASIAAYIKNAPEMPYARIVYFLTNLKNISQEYKDGTNFNKLSNLASHIMSEIDSYSDYTGISFNFDAVDFRDHIGALDKEKAATMYADISEKLLEIIDFDTQEKIDRFPQLEADYVNICKQCIGLH